MYQYDCDRPIDENFLCYIAYHGDSYESVKLYLDIVNLIFKEDIERSLAAGMNAHAVKPIDVKALIETIKHFVK